MFTVLNYANTDFVVRFLQYCTMLKNLNENALERRGTLQNLECAVQNILGLKGGTKLF